MFLAGVLTEAEELQVPAADAPAGSQNEYQGQGQPAVPANSEHSELILCFNSDHVSLSESPDTLSDLVSQVCLSCCCSRWQHKMMWVPQIQSLIVDVVVRTDNSLPPIAYIPLSYFLLCCLFGLLCFSFLWG